MKLRYRSENKSITGKLCILILMLINFQVYAQITIKGTVNDVSGVSIPGASVYEKGTSRGTITDANGLFSLVVANEQAVIEISFLGYLTESQVVGAKREFNVVLIEDITQLTEVVVIGYGQQKKVDLSGAVTAIDMEGLDQVPITSAGEALKGKAAGVMVNTHSGQPGSNPKILIRGRSSINTSNDPLVVVDGIQGVSLSDVNVDDISSISVLKDAASAAIYGSSGANGVILITTKSGTKDKTKIDFSSHYGYHWAPKKFDVLNGEELMDLFREMDQNQGATSILNEYLGDRYITNELIDTNNLYNTDWHDQLYRVSPYQKYSLAISSGTEKTSYRISGSYLTEEGFVPPSGYDRYTFAANINHEVTKRLTARGNFLLSRTQRQTVQTDFYAWNGNPILSVINYPSFLPPKDSAGGYFINPIRPNVDNPLASQYGSLGTTYQTSFNGKIGFDYEILEGLVYSFDAVSRISLQKAENFQSSVHTYEGRNGGGSVSVNGHDNKTIFIENKINYTKTIGNHNAGLFFGHIIEETENSSENKINGKGLIYGDSIPDVNYTNVLTPTAGRGANRKYSYVGRFNYNYKSKYYLQGNFRWDGSIKLGSGNRWDFFPSLSGAWRISEENFMSGINAISEFKLRGSYGYTGNDNFDSFTWASFYELGLNQYPIYGNDQIVSGYAPGNTKPNPNITWEVSEEFNFGLDLSLYKNRINFIFDYFKKNTINQIWQIEIPETSGYTSTYVNTGEVEVKGYDIQLETHNITRSNLRWTTNISYSHDENVVISMGELENRDVILLRGWNNYNLIEKGYPIDAFWGYEIDGIFQTPGEIDELNTSLPDGTPVYYQQDATSPGDIKFRNTNGYERDDEGNLILDANGNPIERITEADKVFLGKPNPDFHFGFNNSIKYKNIELSFFFQGVYGNDIINATRYQAEGMEDWFNQSTTVLERWTPTYTQTDMPRAALSDPNRNNRESERWIEDGSYLRLKTLTLSYNLPEGLLNRLNISGMRIYCTASNVLTFTDYSGYDPETRSGDGNSSYRGMESGGYPQPKSIVFGLNLNL